jgi:hypothetical protein
MIFFFFFQGTWIWTRNFVLVRWMLYHLSHASFPYGSGYLGDRVLLSFQAGLDYYPPILSFLPLLGWQAWATMPSFVSFEMGSHERFLPSLAWNHNPPNLSLPHSMGWQVCAHIPSRWLRWNLTNFFSRLAWNLTSK